MSSEVRFQSMDGGLLQRGMSVEAPRACFTSQSDIHAPRPTRADGKSGRVRARRRLPPP